MLKIYDAAPSGKEAWNKFVRQNYPPVGAFMQTWEWGEFQKSLGRKAERYFISGGNSPAYRTGRPAGEAGEPVAAFTLVHYSLPWGLSYGYVPRGPVIANGADEKPLEIFKVIKKWAGENLPGLIFLRLEPPAPLIAEEAEKHGFAVPTYYIQPRYNHAVFIDKAEEEVAAGFHPSTRSNIRRAEKRGVTVEVKPRVTENDFSRFFAMEKETIARNGGKNAYPSHNYFRSLFEIIPPAGEKDVADNLSICVFNGYRNGEPAAIHFVVFFGDTATYLYGASYAEHLPSKVETYLHWTAMKEAKRRGLKFYDLGGVDEKRWPSLTAFKRQFCGQEFNYAGNIDILLRPFLYRLYNILRTIGKMY